MFATSCGAGHQHMAVAALSVLTEIVGWRKKEFVTSLPPNARRRGGIGFVLCVARICWYRAEQFLSPQMVEKALLRISGKYVSGVGEAAK